VIEAIVDILKVFTCAISSLILPRQRINFRPRIIC